MIQKTIQRIENIIEAKSYTSRLHTPKLLQNFQIFRGSLTTPMIHVTCVFIEYQTKPIVYHSKISSSIAQMHFQSFFKWFLQFRSYDSRYQHFVEYQI